MLVTCGMWLRCGWPGAQKNSNKGACNNWCDCMWVYGTWTAPWPVALLVVMHNLVRSSQAITGGVYQLKAVDMYNTPWLIAPYIGELMITAALFTIGAPHATGARRPSTDVDWLFEGQIIDFDSRWCWCQQDSAWSQSNPSHTHICQPRIHQEARNQWRPHTVAGEGGGGDGKGGGSGGGLGCVAGGLTATRSVALSACGHTRSIDIPVIVPALVIIITAPRARSDTEHRTDESPRSVRLVGCVS